ncbi:MAG: OmpA family protein [Desulfobacterales bacterium]
MRRNRWTGLMLLVILFPILLLSCAGKEVAPAPQSDTPVVVTEPAPPIAVETRPAPVESTFPDGWETFVNQDIYFEKNSAALLPAAQEILVEKAVWLRAHPEIRVVIQGNSDEDGPDEYNFALGDQRAGNVTTYLIEHGVDIARLAVVSNGRETPAVFGRDEASKAKNRRVHFSIDVVD